METKLAMSIARSFHSTTGLELDDLFQQACLLYLEAERQYDPERGTKLTSFVYMRIRNGLIDYCKEQRKLAGPGIKGMLDAGTDEGEDGDIEYMDGYPNPTVPIPEHDAAVREFVAHLEPDARQVCAVVLGDSRHYAPLHWYTARTTLKRELRGMGWSGSKIQWVLQQVRRAVTNELGGRLESRV